MNELSPFRLWLMRAAFLLLVVAVLFFHLLPLETSPRRWAAPDLILGFACAWCLRRPEYVPAVSLAALFLLTDLLFQRPPGLWATLALIGCEYLKTSGRSLREFELFLGVADRGGCDHRDSGGKPPDSRDHVDRRTTFGAYPFRNGDDPAILPPDRSGDTRRDGRPEKGTR